MTATSLIILAIVVAIAFVLARFIGFIVYVVLVIGIILWALQHLTGFY